MNSFGYVDKNKNMIQEEKENLENNLNHIDSIVSDLKKEANELKEKVEDYRNDYEFLSYFRELSADYKKTVDSMNNLNEKCKSPYFGHMYLMEEKENEDIFVGKSSICGPDGKNIVYDWRSPVCSLFYANQQSYKYKNINYDVKYKRKILIKDRELISCVDLYDSSKDAGVTDNFLKEVLREKKKNAKFTDIISTIQSKQNNIIRNKLDRNIICQGVAGSGKTVIIIHRLSYLLFNNPDLNPQQFLFIAPNENFKKELSDLNVQLQIDKIKLMTLYEYYIEKFNTYLNLSVNDRYYIKTIVNDENIDINYEYSDEALIIKYKKIEEYVSSIILNIKEKYFSEITNNDGVSWLEEGKNIYNFLTERVRRFSEITKKLKNNISFVFESEIEQYDGDVKSLLNEMLGELQKNDESLNINMTLDEIETKIVSAKGKLKKIENSFFKFLQKNSYNMYINEISCLLKLKRIKDVQLFQKNIDCIKNNYVGFEEEKRVALNSKLDNLCAKIITNSNDDLLVNNVLNYIGEINKLVDVLQQYDINYDLKNKQEIYDLILPRNIIKKCFEEICVEEYKLNSTFSNKKYYRIDIFTILFILTKLGYSGYSKYKYLYIDEAQDYNDVEIKLVSKIEAGSVLNIFGDYRQNISRNSILRSNWDELKKYFGDNLDYYELNENYRNTINVVNYCNDMLKLKMLGIGIDGDDVLVRKYSNIDEIIERAKETDPIIITNDSSLLEHISKNSNIKVFNVFDVKGLEFKRVIVIDDGFKDNEKYVAYTRSLGDLEIYIKD